MIYKELPGPIEGYKVFNDDMTCRDFQFRLEGRNILPNDRPLELCGNGFHFCKHPSGVWTYYSSGRVFKIRAYGVLDAPSEPGADYKLVCRELELLEEIKIGGDRNTGHGNTGSRNTGHGNTGDWNTGDWNTGDRNTGHQNTGHGNTGHQNTGDWNTGHQNTGHQNTGHQNTGHQNTGDWNTGDWNLGSYHTGYFGMGEAPVYMFGKVCKVEREDLDHNLISQLGKALSQDEPFDPTPYLTLPNATKTYIKRLHKAMIAARKEPKP